MADNKEKREDILYQMIYDSIRDKFSILPVISGLTLALLSVGLSGGLFEISNTIKCLATILLAIMMLSIQVYFYNISHNLHEASKRFYKLADIDIQNKEFTIVQSIKYILTGKIDGFSEESVFFKRFSSQFTRLAIMLMWFVIVIMIIEIWI